LSNVKQITLAQFMYMSDFDDAVAMNRDCTLVSQGSPFAPCRLGRGVRGWIDLVSPYVKSYDVFKSPSDPVQSVPLPRGTRDSDGNQILNGFIWGPRDGILALGGDFRSSYARNNNFANNGTYTARGTQAEFPGTLILIYSFTANSGGGANGNEGIPGSSFTIIRHRDVHPTSGTCVSMDSRSEQNNRSNFFGSLPRDGQQREASRPSSERYHGLGLYGFADGHAKALRPSRIRGQCQWGNQVEFGNDGIHPDFRF
jgi:hypothetical protein